MSISSCKPSIEVWRIEVTSAENNEHGVDRVENYKAKLDVRFPTEAEAKEYIKNKTRIHTEVANFLIDIAKDETDDTVKSQKKEAFMDEFCFTNDLYMRYRRFFLHKVPWDRVKQALLKNGIEVVKL